MLKVRIKETSETCPRLLGMTVAHLWPRPRPPSHLAPCRLCPPPLCPPALIRVRVVCCGLRTPPDTAFPSLYLFAHKVPLKVSRGLPSCICRIYPPLLPSARLHLKVLLETCAIRESTGYSEARPASNRCRDHLPSLCLSCPTLCKMR